MLIDSSGLSKVKDSVTKQILLGNEPKPELIAILAVYFVQGILGLARLAVSFFLKDELHLSPVEVSALLGIVALPWMIKPLFGFISDGLPIFGYRRRPYLVLSGILGSAAWVSLSTLVHTSLGATIAIALSSLSVAFSDVIVDSLVVERARSESQAQVGSLQSICWGATALGGLITAYFSGLLLEYFTTRTVFLVTALFPLIISAAAWIITETPIHKNTPGNHQTNPFNVSTQLKQLRQVFTQKAIWLPTLFIFLWQSTPSGDAAFFFFFTNELHFEPEFLGRVHLVTSLASLIGIWIFQRFLKSVPFRVICGWSIIISTALRMTILVLVTHTNRALGIDDHWFSLGDSLILTVMGQIAFMPVMVLAARICPLGIEATLFSLIMSIFNLGGAISKEFGALIMHWLGITDTSFDALWILVIITNLSALLPLLFIKLLPEKETEITQLAATSANN
ncbi:folate/biopterin family MFS transporter [Anabaena cylindrica FACHB-243]|uniref:Folate/biopterin transporter n=1 Tax=Anabaena cylindrica (strain ATCC 27899 / PCC 7122) TaxID=272123 RepID=K9Z8V7_ANACC|nr:MULTISPECIES: folate/biopterin family MFS transporter [Anabaena]AFZ55633.1 folate/biopterin transporter [Anabaena cylindrica PCC 7122]MBD2420427.1 folate/biopterin family MFS transporter [Anabaena cylindrica FACHB-243]MBY5281845.1 folate/biopterin family MFS transporter [Anabaena sp. CCAP 1446/1C]MBY5310066.1 folate/biopterin family MFS transporter [Anabaena sp. CCAP 1446/1C]MCM2406947.1 folate/biopterin family MFS transporter [Anabaena sp. CCAP 1446/1C]